MPARNVHLTDDYDEFVDKLVTSGRLSKAGAVIQAGVRLREPQAREDVEKVALLRSLACEGFGERDQGQGIPIVDEAGLVDFIGRIGHRAAEPCDPPLGRARISCPASASRAARRRRAVTAAVLNLEL